MGGSSTLMAFSFVLLSGYYSCLLNYQVRIAAARDSRIATFILLNIFENMINNNFQTVLYGGTKQTH